MKRIDVILQAVEHRLTHVEESIERTETHLRDAVKSMARLENTLERLETVVKEYRKEVTLATARLARHDRFLQDLDSRIAKIERGGNVA